MHRFLSKFLLIAISCLAGDAMSELLIDDRSSAGLGSNLGPEWRFVSDGVMGGRSAGRLTLEHRDGRDCLHLQGQVRLENNGGFVQINLDLDRDGPLDASAYAGVELEVYGNGEEYNLHLKTSAVWLPWQSYRAGFQAPPEWRSIRLPFAEFEPYRIGKPLDPGRLERIGLVAIGRAFEADICLGRLALYRG
jgi:hypothetical protein